MECVPFWISMGKSNIRGRPKTNGGGGIEVESKVGPTGRPKCCWQWQTQKGGEGGGTSGIKDKRLDDRH